MLIEILLKKCDKNKCDPFIVEVWLDSRNFAQKSATWISVTHFIVKDLQGVTFFGVALFRVGDWQEAGW